MVSTQRGKPQNSQPTSFSSTSTSSSSSSSSISGRIQRSRSRVLLGRRTREDLRHEEADAELIVMRINRCENFPNGSLMTLRCPPEVHLETARKIIKEAAPRLRLPDPSTYVEMVHEARRLAIREEWRTIFEFYVKTVPPEQLGLITGASSSLSSSSSSSPPASNSIPSSIPSAPNCHVASSSSLQPPSSSEDAPSSSNAPLPSEMENVPSNNPSNSAAEFAQQQNRRPELAVSNPPVPHVVTNRDVAFLSSHRTNSVVAPANLTIQTDSYTGSLLFVKRFRFSDTQSPRPLRTRLERGLIVGLFEITDHARAFKITTKEAYDYTVLTSEEFDLYVSIIRRLDEAEKYYSDDDIEEMKSMILDPEASCVKTESGEYCYFTKISCGSLHMLAIEQPLHVREECQRFFNTLVRFVAFCHALGIVLVDISLRRFIFDDRDRSRLRMRCFTDVLVMKTPTASDKVKSKFGCPAYIAPEVLLPEPHGGMKADIWSLGIILFVLVTGRFPFSDVTARGLLNKVKRAKVEIPPTAGNLSPQVRSLIFGLLQRHPRDRPSADLIKNLPWINGRERLVNSMPPRSLPRNMKIEEDDLNLHYEMDTPLPYPNTFLDLSLSGRAPSLFTHQNETISPCMACKALGHSDHKMLDIFGE